MISIQRSGIVWLALTTVAGAQSVAPGFFNEKLYRALENAQCRSCHNDNGVASATRLQFPTEKAPAQEVEEFGLRLRVFVDPNKLDDSLLLRKPTNRVPHTGG